MSTIVPNMSSPHLNTSSMSSYTWSLDLDITNFKRKKVFEENEINEPDDIINWLLYLDKHRSFKKVKMFLQYLKDYYNKKGIKLVLIWDQINVMDRERTKSKQSAVKFYETSTNSDVFFNCIIKSASNNNESIKSLEKSIGFTKAIELDPFTVFDKTEFFTLVKFETNYYKPIDVKPELLDKYILSLCYILKFSISEYHYFKDCFWNKKDVRFEKEYYSKELLDKFPNSRRDHIYISETKFQKEYITNSVALCSYYANLRMLLTFEEIEKMEENVKVNFNINKILKKYIFLI